MTRILALIMALAIGAPTVAAQTVEGFTARTGLAFSGIDTANPGFGTATGFVASAGIEFGLLQDLVAAVEAEYAIRGYTWSTREPGADEHTASAQLQYLSFPTFVRIYVPTTPELQLFLAAGPRIDILMSKEPADIVFLDGTEVPDGMGAAIETGVGGGISFAGGLNFTGLFGRWVGLEVRYVLGMNDLTPDLFGQSTSLRAVDLTLVVAF